MHIHSIYALCGAGSTRCDDDDEQTPATKPHKTPHGSPRTQVVALGPVLPVCRVSRVDSDDNNDDDSSQLTGGLPKRMMSKEHLCALYLDAGQTLCMSHSHVRGVCVCGAVMMAIACVYDACVCVRTTTGGCRFRLQCIRGFVRWFRNRAACSSSRMSTSAVRPVSMRRPAQPCRVARALSASRRWCVFFLFCLHFTAALSSKISAQTVTHSRSHHDDGVELRARGLCTKSQPQRRQTRPLSLHAIRVRLLRVCVSYVTGGLIISRRALALVVYLCRVVRAQTSGVCTNLQLMHVVCVRD